jgi:CRP-like cAMP-binding protein
MLLDSEHILHTCENNCGFHNRLIYNLMRDLAEKTVLFHERIEITSKRTTRDKLLAYLLAASRRAGSASFTIPFDPEITSLVCTAAASIGVFLLSLWRKNPVRMTYVNAYDLLLESPPEII